MANALTVDELLIDRFKTSGFPRVNPETSDADLADKTLFRANPNRLAFVVVNLSTGVIFIAPLGAAASTRGIRLNANGGLIAMDYESMFQAVAYEWHVIGDADNLALFSMEIVTKN